MDRSEVHQFLRINDFGGETKTGASLVHNCTYVQLSREAQLFPFKPGFLLVLGDLIDRSPTRHIREYIPAVYIRMRNRSKPLVKRVQSGALNQGAQLANVPDVFAIEEALDQAGCRRNAQDRLHQVASLLHHFTTRHRVFCRATHGGWILHNA